MDIKGKFKQFISNVKNFIGRIPIKNFFCNLKNGIVNFFNSLKSKIKNIFSKQKTPKVKKEKIKKGKRFSLKNNKVSLWFKKYRKERNLALLVLSSLAFLITVCIISMNIESIFGTHQSKAKFIDDGEIKYIGIKDGFITERLIVEAGDLLPSISDYFSDGYVLANNVTISYFFENNAIPIENFTERKNDMYYVKGANTNIVVLINNNGEEYQTNLLIRDSLAPDIQLSPVTINKGDYINPISFVALYVDNSKSLEFTAEMVTKVDNEVPGTYVVEIKVCDSSSNCTQESSTLTINKKVSTGNGGNTGGDKDKPTGGTSSPTGGNSSENDSGNDDDDDGKKPTTPTTPTTPTKPTTPDPDDDEDEGGSDDEGGSSSNVKPGKGGSTLIAADPRVEVGTYTKNNFNLVINHYGTTETTFYESVTYTLYDDGSADVLKYSGQGKTTWNFSGFKASTANLKLMKRDAISLTMSDVSFYNKLKNTFLKKTNKLRTSAGVGTVEIDEDLCIIAQMRLYEIVYGNQLSHTRPNGTNFHTIIGDYGYSAGTYNNNKLYGENISYGQSSNDDAFEALATSSGHYENMVKGYFTKMGVARVSFNRVNYWVQIFTT